MDRIKFDKYITKVYGVAAEYPWVSAPSFAVYRHSNNNKWFAVVMDIPKSKFGVSDNENIVAVTTDKPSDVIAETILKAVKNLF